MADSTCTYCGESLSNSSNTGCDWCNKIIQEANCEGIYLVDAAVAVRKRDDLNTPDERRAAIQATFDRYAGR